MSVAQREVAEDEAEIRLDRWFRRHYPQVTQGALQKLCRTGQIRVDGKRAEASTRLAVGQSVRIPPLPDPDAPPPPMPVDPHAAAELEKMLLYRDDQVIVLNKPHGLPTQGGPGIKLHLDGMLEAWREGPRRPLLVHRLDRDTSGVLLLGRTPGAAAKLAAAFRSHYMQKTYWAVVLGRPVPPEGIIDQPLMRAEGLRGERMAVAARNDEAAVRALTAYRTLDYAGRKLSWLELQPQTGRTHQLRVHCVAIEAPILGDGKYGGDARYGEVPALLDGFSDQLHLHARKLELPHPAGGRLAVEADLPGHMRETFRRLGFTAPPARPPQRS